MMIMMNIINFIIENDDYDGHHQFYNMKIIIMMKIINFKART